MWNIKIEKNLENGTECRILKNIAAKIWWPQKENIDVIGYYEKVNKMKMLTDMTGKD